MAEAAKVTEAVKVAEVKDRIYNSLEDLVASGASEVEFTIIDGFKAGEKVRLGSVTAGDIMEWSEANEGEAKRTAGLRLIMKSLVDEKGERYANHPKNIAVLRTMRHKETDRMVNAVLKLNGMIVKKTDDEAKKD